MKTTMKVISLCVWVIGLLLVSTPVMAQVGNSDLYETAPGVTFQSTSTMQTSGSMYAKQPVMDADGNAVYRVDAADPSQQQGSGPRKINPVAAPSPVGDALVPLMLFALLFSALIFLRRRGVKE